MNSDEAEMRHFSATVKPCRHGKKPTLKYEPGCWEISCGEGCKCSVIDGDNASPHELVLGWGQING